MAGKKILLGVTGGIAAYKSLSLLRALVLMQEQVTVLPTESALKFVGLPSFESLSRNPVPTDLFGQVSEVKHVSLGQQADLMIIAPATANTIAKLAHGLADNLLTNAALVTRAPILIAPAMHTEMWQHPATQANIATLTERGVIVLGPANGQLTGSDFGPGRMVEPEQIAAAARKLLYPKQDLLGKRVLVTAGGTREALDPVRFLGNRSSGKQGIALSEAARARGANVTLIGANLEAAVPSAIDCVQVTSTAELSDALAKKAPDADLIIMAAAVADFRPAETSELKLKKQANQFEYNLPLVVNPDLLQGLVSAKSPNQVIVGFAAETKTGDELLAIARDKLSRKGCDYLVVNQVGWQQGFGSDSNAVTILSADGTIVAEASGSKRAVADSILDSIAQN